MKDDSLIVACLNRCLDEVMKFGPMYETTEQKYIFEPVVDGDNIKYREIFTGFIANVGLEYFMLPYFNKLNHLQIIFLRLKEKRFLNWVWFEY